MRRLVWLVVALLLARYAVVLVATRSSLAGDLTDYWADYAVRDALVLGLGAVVLFMVQAPAWMAPLASPVTRLRRLQHWPLFGRFMAALGVGLAAAAAAWITLGDFDQSSGGTAQLAVRGLWMTAVLALGVGAFWPGPPVDGFRPRYRWELDAAGRYVRRVLQSSDSATMPVGHWSRGWTLALIGLVTLAAAVVVRFVQLTELPGGCIATECTRALALAESAPGGVGASSFPGFLAWTTALIYRYTGDGLWSLRLAAGLWSLALLPLVYGGARLYTRAGGAAVAVIFLALSPWLFWTARLSHMWLALPFWLAWTLWAAARTVRNPTVGAWAAMGAGLGALLIEGPELRFFTLVWAGLLLLEAMPAARRAGLTWAAVIWRATLSLAALLVVALPGLAWQARATDAPLEWLPGAFEHSLGELVLALVRPGPLAVASGPVAPLVAALWAALALLGVGYLVCRVAQPGARLLVTGLALWTIGVLGLDWIMLDIGGALLPLLPWLALGIAVAVDQIFASFQITWRPLIAAPRSLAGGLALALLLAVWQLPPVLDALEQIDQGQASSLDTAMGRYLAQCLQTPAETLCAHADDEPPPLILLPGPVLNSPNVRLLAGAALDDTRVRALDSSRDLLPPTDTLATDSASLARGRVYFVPLENPQLLELLQQIYPGAEATAPATETGPTLFAVLRVTPAALAAHQGLQGAYHQGTEFVMASEADLVQRDGPLALAWDTGPPLPPPFTVAWEGSLLAPVAGTYEFDVAFADAGAQNLPPLSLQLDEHLVLDTTLGMTQHQMALVQGPYRLRLYLRIDADQTMPRGMTIRWRPPGGEFAPIPRQMLHSPPLPQAGLVGTYYGSAEWQGPILAQRKDFLLEPAADLPQPYSVRWEGKVAATRAGEYLFAVSGSGLTQILVDGRFLLDYAPGRDLADDPGFAQAGIYLARGWRTIEIRHAPDGGRSNLRILWQPPGSGPELLRSRYLLPTTGDTTSNTTLPALPELWDARLGDDTFALSYLMEAMSDLGTQTVALPPGNLPALPVAERWGFARCGSGVDQLNAPHGVALDLARGVVYVADTGNRRIARFSLIDGAPLPPITDERFTEPTDIAIPPLFLAGDAGVESPAVNPAGIPVFVLDAVAHSIFRLEPAADGSGDRTLVDPVPIVGSFYRPRGFSVDEQGVFWVADTGGARVVALGADGQVLTQIGGQATTLGRGQPVDVIAVNGVRWAVTAEDGRLWQLETSGSIPVIQRVNTIDGPHLAALPNGSFFLTDPVNRAFTLHAPSGEPLRRHAAPDTFVHPTGIATAQAGDQVLIAVVDSSACGLSLWQMPVAP